MVKRYTEKKRGRPFLPDAIFTFNDTAAVMFRTTYLNHEFVSALNAAYRLRLSRVADIELKGGDHPCYSYYDEHARLAYVVIGRPVSEDNTGCFGYYDKLLLVRGRDAWDFQQRIYRDLTEPRPEPSTDEPLDRQHWEMLNQLNEGAFVLDTFCFGQQGAVTSMYSGPIEDMPHKTAVFIKNLQSFLTSLFDNLQWHLCNEEEEL